MSELSLTFTVTHQSWGRHVDVELKPGGRSIPVTNDNVVEYIHRIADFRLNRELRGPCIAFLGGFFRMVSSRRGGRLGGRGGGGWVLPRQL